MKYTVADFAKKIGKSKAEVYAMCKGLLLPYVKLEQGKKVIDDAALSLFAEREVEKDNVEAAENNAEEVRKSAEQESEAAPAAEGTISKDEVIAYLKARVEKLEAQVEEKDNFIKELTMRYTETVQTNNLITAQQQERILLLEDGKKRRPSLFSRIFGKKEGPTA